LDGDGGDGDFPRRRTACIDGIDGDVVRAAGKAGIEDPPVFAGEGVAVCVFMERVAVSPNPDVNRLCVGGTERTAIKEPRDLKVARPVTFSRPNREKKAS